MRAALPHLISIGDKYGPAMGITSQDEATAYFERLIEHSMGHGLSRAKAIDVEKQNLGYFAGYCDHDTRERVERLFDCEHPVFGKIAGHVPTTEEALCAGMLMGLGFKKGVQ